MQEYEVNWRPILIGLGVLVACLGIYLIFFSSKNNEPAVGYGGSRSHITKSNSSKNIEDASRTGYFGEKIPGGVMLGARRGEYIWKKNNSVMVYVPKGPFTMGDNEVTAAKPLHSVDLSGYYIDKYEITAGQFKRFCEDTGREHPQQPQWSNEEDHPVVNVTWRHARDYGNWTGKKLPTEAQWEKAARGGIKIPALGGTKIPIASETNRYPVRIYSWGNGLPNAGSYRCNYRADDNVETQGKDGYSFAAPVGSFATHEGSIYGSCDLIGNVKEWCRDYYSSGYKRQQAKDPTGPGEGETYVTRGGGWDSDAKTCRLGYRTFALPSHSNSALGFRLVKEMD